MATSSDDYIPQYPGTGTIGVLTDLFPFFHAGDPQKRLMSLSDLRDSLTDVAPGIDSITQTILYSDMAGVTTTGTLTMTGVLPAGAIILGTKLLVTAGFAGDTSAVLTVGDTDVDRCHTGTPSVFATAATGVETGVVSGLKLVTTAFSPICIVTTAADFTSVSAGSFTITIYYIRTV